MASLAHFKQISEFEWLIEPFGSMRVPCRVIASAGLLRDMDDTAIRQIQNVAGLPGVVEPACLMPDAHFGYGFPIGGVAAFDPARGGVVSAGGVGFDIACGVRTLLTGLHKDEISPHIHTLADLLFETVPSGVGQGGNLRLSDTDLEAMLRGGASWAVGEGFGVPSDLGHMEENGRIPGAEPKHVSKEAKKRIRDQVGTLGSGNHYLEIQYIDEIFEPEIAEAWGLRPGLVAVSIHCGSRGLGHQIGTDYLKEMVAEAPRHGIKLPEKELACAPAESELGRRYLGAVRAGINCALANRQVITHLVREVFDQVLGQVIPNSDPALLYDVSHNTCKLEEHEVKGKTRRLLVHRKGATRSFGPGRPELGPEFQKTGQPVLVGGSMGAPSYIMAGTSESMHQAFGSACHGAGRAMSRAQAKKRFKGKDVLESLRCREIFVRTGSYRGAAEEAPGAYKDVDEVIRAAAGAGTALRVARLLPMACVKG